MKEKRLTAIVRHSRNGNITAIVRNYPTKKAFAEDVKGNGLRLLGMFTDKEIETMKNYTFLDIIGKGQMYADCCDYIQQVL